jgi:hypothetical protein
MPFFSLPYLLNLYSTRGSVNLDKHRIQLCSLRAFCYVHVLYRTGVLETNMLEGFHPISAKTTAYKQSDLCVFLYGICLDRQISKKIHIQLRVS